MTYIYTKSQTRTLVGTEASVTEYYEERDCPKRNRDWDFEGDYQALCAELRKDSREYACRFYAIILDVTRLGANNCNCWMVWRLDENPEQEKGAMP